MNSHILIIITNVGAQFGTVVALPLTGEICGGAWGWPGVFYTMGVAAIVWAVLWLIFGADTPATSRFISEAEQEYIETSLGQVGERPVSKNDLTLLVKNYY